MNATVKQSLHYLSSFDFEAVKIMRYSYYGDLYYRYVNALVAELTGFKSMTDMAEAGGNYRPSLNVSDKEYGEAFTHIANAYDLDMSIASDDRRAYRF